MPALTPQSILVTGASSGFGRLIAQTLARSGHAVTAGVRDPAGKNARVTQELRDEAQAAGQRLQVVALDVTQDGSVDDAVAQTVAANGRIDVLVNNAGVFAVGLQEGYSDAQTHLIFETNFFGAQRCIRAVLPQMHQQGSGLLIAVSSSSATLPAPFTGVYTASKRALDGLCESYRYELAPLGIDSVLIQSGGYPTAIFDNALGPAETERLAAYGPLAAVPEQVFKGFAAFLGAPGGANPQDMADAVLALVQMPLGTRPLRTVVDHYYSPLIAAVNQVTQERQELFMQGMGLAHLLGPKGPEST